MQFSVSNFRCFRKLQTLNFAASSYDKSLPENCVETNLPGLAGKRWVKGIVLYGANASGKTTVLTALSALTNLVTNSAKTTDPKEPINSIEPFAICEKGPQTPTGFAISFVTEGTRYEYRVAATREQIWHESLRAFPNKVEQLWFSRDWDASAGGYKWSPDRPTGFERDSKLESYTLSNVLFLSKGVASNRSELEPIFRWFKDQLVFLDLGAESMMSAEFTLEQLAKKTSLSEGIVKLLHHADLGVTAARAIERKPPEGFEKFVESLPPEVRERFGKERWIQPELTHRGGAVEIPLPWDSESAGTKRFFSLAGPWLDILSNGYTVCIAELETSMHPLMVRELLRLVFSSNENTDGAQILFTTHSPLLLDATLMRRDQIWFTDKDDNGEAHLYPLTDYSPREGESLVRGYLAGRYGAVPFVPAGLLGTLGTHQAIRSSSPSK